MLKKNVWLIATMLFVCIFTFGILHSSETQADLADEIAKADIEYGEYLSAECVTCHRSSGASKGIPIIHGIKAETFVAYINAYRKKERKNEVMQMMASGLDREQILSLAAYFSSLPK